MREKEEKVRPVLAVKLTFLFFCFFFSPLSELKIRLKSKSFQEQNKTKKKSNKHHKNILNTLSVSSLSLFFSSLSFQKKTSIFIREFVLYFESDEKRNKTVCLFRLVF